MTKDYLRKNISFDMLNEEEKKLYEDLQKLPHGEFNKRTKLFWKVCFESKEESE